MKLRDSDWSEYDFLEMLEDARELTYGDREDDFLDGLEEKHIRYGEDMWLSEKQEMWLMNIASRKPRPFVSPPVREGGEGRKKRDS